MVEFGILGPLEVRDDGRLLPLRQGRPLSLLTALLLRLGKVASVDALVEEVWGEQALADSVNALQVQVSYLRRTIGLGSGADRPALRTVGAGYPLDVDPDSLDAHRFEVLIHAAAAWLAAPRPVDANVALEELRAALDLWRGSRSRTYGLLLPWSPRPSGWRSCGRPRSSTRWTLGWRSASTISPCRRYAS